MENTAQVPICGTIEAGTRRVRLARGKHSETDSPDRGARISADTVSIPS